LSTTTNSFIPLHDRILVRRIDESDQTASGLYLPDAAKEKPQQGEVVAVGQGRRNDQGRILAPEIEPGNHVLFGKYSGTDIRLDGVEYVIMREEEVLGILNPRN
jgi:chaperonin GroES